MLSFFRGQIAQSVEQRTENPCVASSILALAKFQLKKSFFNTFHRPLTLVDDLFLAKICFFSYHGQKPDRLWLSITV